MAKKREQQRKPKLLAPPPTEKEKDEFGKAALAWGALVVLIVGVLAVLEMVKERLQ